MCVCEQVLGRCSFSHQVPLWFSAHTLDLVSRGRRRYWWHFRNHTVGTLGVVTKGARLAFTGGGVPTGTGLRVFSFTLTRESWRR